MTNRPESSMSAMGRISETRSVTGDQLPLRMDLQHAHGCHQIVATDIDHVAVKRLYLDYGMPDNILPLVQNVADPSPN